MRTRVPLPIRYSSVGLLVAWLVSGLATTAAAQTQMIPYFGKNNIHYDKFEWYIYTTDHFEIFYYPALQQHLERIAGYAESAYQQISADLKHDLPRLAAPRKASARSPSRCSTGCCCRSTIHRTSCTASSRTN